MYLRGEHNPPHLHVKYGSRKACIDIRDGSLIKGSLPQTQFSLAVDWIAAHRGELLAMWENRLKPGGVYKITDPPGV